MKPSSPASSLEKSLGYAAARFTRLLLKRISGEFSQHGLPITSEQYSFLVHVWEQDGLPQGALIEKTAKDKTTIARLAAGLERLGLIVRQAAPGDARERQVFLTEEGRGTMEVATRLARGILEQALDGIDEAEVAVCREVLLRAGRNLQK